MNLKTKRRAQRRPKSDADAPCATASAAPAEGSFPVIAMAASAGGLHALSVILSTLPADFPAAIAIVMHLSPDHPSLLAEILNRRTPLKVKQAHTGDILCASCVFIAPPNHHLFVAAGGRLKLSSASAVKVNYARPSAEPLFASVAAVYRTQAIAVVLTGGDGDGSMGVQIIQQQGGHVIAQDRPTSQDFSMPESSIKTGDVDFILPLDQIASKLMALVERGGVKPRAATPLYAVHAASPPAGQKPSVLAEPAVTRGLKRPKGRAPTRHTQSPRPRGKRSPDNVASLSPKHPP